MPNVRTLAAGLVLVATLATSCSQEPARSEAAYCRVWKAEATKLQAKYQGAADDAEADPLAALLTVMESPGDLKVLFDKLAKVAPDEVLTEVEAVRDSIAEMQDDAGDAASDPLGSLGSMLVSSLTNAGAWKTVGQYTADHCGLPPYE